MRTLAIISAVLLGYLTGAFAQGLDVDLRKPRPDSGSQAYRRRVTALIGDRYPSLLTGKPSGTPVLTVLFNPDGSVADSALDLLPRKDTELSVSEGQFARFGFYSGDLQYIGVDRINLRTSFAIVVFGALQPKNLDRELVDRLFPKLLDSKPPANDQIWILFDHEGKVVKRGEEAVDPSRLVETLQMRYPGIHTAEVTLSSVVRRDGRPLEDADGNAVQLECVWLAARSPLPQESRP